MLSQCGVCRGEKSKYKCPSCRLPYCSLTCWNNHKQTACKQTTGTSNTTEQDQNHNAGYAFHTEDTVPLEKLALLEGNSDLRHMLDNPHIQTMLSAIDSSENPVAAMSAAMMEPDFAQFADMCLQIVDSATED